VHSSSTTLLRRDLTFPTYLLTSTHSIHLPRLDILNLIPYSHTHHEAASSPHPHLYPNNHPTGFQPFWTFNPASTPAAAATTSPAPNPLGT
jgi:hypothetical protein